MSMAHMTHDLTAQS